MKQLQLDLKKRLLIVEFEDVQHLENIISCHNTGIRFMSDKEELTKLICKGSELTEDVAKLLVEQKQVFDTPKVFFFKNYKTPFSDCMTALESFISAIEAKGWKFGKNNIKYPIKENYGHHDNINVLDDPPEWDEKEYYEDLDKWMDAESRTLNPEKTLIFEIL